MDHLTLVTQLFEVAAVDAEVGGDVEYAARVEVDGVARRPMPKCWTVECRGDGKKEVGKRDASQLLSQEVGTEPSYIRRAGQNAKTWPNGAKSQRVGK
jgi:hypothetical protein